jgi:acetyl esterase/lipase
MKITAFIVALFLWSILFTGCTNKTTDPVPEPDVKTITDIHYVEGDTSARRALDVYYKPDGQQKKVLMFVPGGAWRQGDKNLYTSLATVFCKYYNMTVVVINYRLSDSTQGNAVHPDHIKDVAAAFRWVKQNIGPYGGNKDYIYLFGQSAGAHLAALLATDSQYLTEVGCSTQDIKGLIAMSGVYELSNLVTLPANPLGLSVTDVMMYRVMVQNAFGSTDTSVINPASPVLHLSSSLPPIMIIHTELDMPGFSVENENFYTLVKGFNSVPAQIYKLYQTDYSPETWQTATAMAAAEPAVSEYIGHYAEVVAINEPDRQKAPTSWIVNFINQH